MFITIQEAPPQKPQELKTYLEVLWDKAKPFYREYKNAKQIIYDIENSDKGIAFYRLFNWFFDELKCFSDYPLCKQQQKFDYTTIDEKNEVESIIMEAFLAVLKEFREDLTILDSKKESDIYNMLAKRIRHRARYNIYKTLQIQRVRRTDPETKKVISKYIRKEFPVPEVKPKKTDSVDFLDRLVEKETKRFIRSKIIEFLRGRDKDDAIIFYASILKNAEGEWDKHKFKVKLTEKELAQQLGISRDVVKYRKVKLKRDFKEFWQNEIKPYI
jgi:hypothetical protein